MKELSSITFSCEFIEKWKFVLKNLYDYEFHEEFAIVPSLFGKKTYSYLPLLNYTDRTSQKISDLLNKVKDRDYQIGVLNPGYKSFMDHDTVTMRIDLQKRILRNCSIHRFRRETKDTSVGAYRKKS